MLLVLSFAFAGPAYELLRLRDPVTCLDLGAATPALREELAALTEPAVLPSSVQVRASVCLTERFADDPVVHAQFGKWMLDSERAGLALVVLQRAEALPRAVALDLARQALTSGNHRVVAYSQAFFVRSGEPVVAEPPPPAALPAP